MEVLSCSDVQYVGDTNCPQRHSGIKPSDDIHEEKQATLLPADCSHQRSLDELSLSLHNGERTSLVIDHAYEMHGHDQPNSQQRPREELLYGTDSGEGILQKLNGPKKCFGDELLNETYEIEVSIQRVDSPHLTGCNLSNDTYGGGGTFPKVDEISKEVCNKDGSIELLPYLNIPCSDNPSCFKLEQVQVSETIDRVVEFLLPGGDIGTADVLPNSETVCCGTSDLQLRESGDMRSGFLEPSDSLPGANDLELGSFDDKSQNREPFSISQNPCHHFEESELSNTKQEEGVSLIEDDCPEDDDTVALWVKWRGKWQAGIRCSRADWPLSTVKAKPTHGRKKYVVVFFPHSRIHCWADMLLVCSINELPEPLAYGTHYTGLEMVKDLTVPRRYIMQKLAVTMLNFGDQLHNSSVIESARNVTAWKEFAMEACRCECYSDLGRMLLKLHSMILPAYIDPDWLEHSFDSWAQHCQDAQSAASIETLKEELVDSIVWNEIEALWDAPIQPDLGSEWKTWMQEVMKWFSTSHPTVGVGHAEQRNCDDTTSACPQISSRKRQKLEVRRPEIHASQGEANAHVFLSQAIAVETDTQFFNCRPLKNATPSSGSCKEESFTRVAATIQDSENVSDRWYEIVVVDAANPEFLRTTEAGTAVEGGSGTELLLDAQHGSHSENKYRQCMAFIEAKGRQCGRWANDGDIYCCVHLGHHFVDKTSMVEQTPPSLDYICEGMTNLGTRCKHRSRTGSSFCKKHRLQGSQNNMDSENPLISSGNELKREFEKISSSEFVGGKEIVLVGEDQTATRDKMILLTVDEASDGRNNLMEISELSGASSTPLKSYREELQHCIVQCPQTNEQCLDRVKLHTLYCEKHLPGWLKRARHGKTRIISKDVFIELLRNCSSRKQKVHLHQACELLYRFMKSALSHRNKVSKETLMGWILSEASKDIPVVEYLLEVVSRERDKIGRLWGFSVDNIMDTTSLGSEPRIMPEANMNTHGTQMTIKCKICMEEYFDDNALGIHWMEAHKKEAQWLFRGFACAICLNSFTNRKVLEAHLKERHNIQSLDECILFQCMPCGSHFVNPEHLWLHVLKLHASDFRLPTVSQLHNHSTNQDAQSKHVLGNKPSLNNDSFENHSDILDDSRRFSCKLCGLKFDLLPDLGRHHQVAHMGQNPLSHFPPKKRSHLNRPKLKPGRPGRPRFNKGLGAGAAFTIQNSAGFNMKKHFHTSNSVSSMGLRLQNQSPEIVGLDQSVESHCSDVAEILFPELQKTKPRPSNLEILSVARSTCCKINLHAALEAKYGFLPERLYLKAAKLCSELNIRVEWHLEGFVCPKGCKPLYHSYPLATLLPHSDRFAEPPSALLTDTMNGEEWEMEECHYVLSLSHFKQKNAIVLCDDLSFGRESVPVPCVVDEDLKTSVQISTYGKSNIASSAGSSMPWEGFTYVTERLLDPCLGLDTKSSQLGCACLHPTCYPENCDHVYLFNNDYENAEDINGKSMHGKFAYDEDGRIILEEGYLVYECNSMCSCDRTCRNRVLQKGLQVKLEVFKTLKKGWAVRAGEAIPRGTFVCEYVGEVLSDQEASKRGKRYDNEGCSYLYDINAHIEDMNGMNEGTVPYVIDATKYGNVSRFINHSCSPNLVNYQVLVESMDCQQAHIGFYASRDIAVGEEVAYDYRYQLPGESPCYCGASNCRGHLY